MSTHPSFSNPAACSDPDVFVARGCKVEDEVGKDDICHPKLGVPSTGWASRGLDGRLFGYVCRFDVSEKSKKPRNEYRPYFYGRFDKGNPSWRWKDKLNNRQCSLLINKTAIGEFCYD